MNAPVPTTDAEVPEFWRALGLPGLIDVHTHFMPPNVLEKVWAYFDAAGPLVGREWPIAYRMDEAERLRALRGLGVRSFTSMVYPHKPGMAEWLNAWAADFARRTPDCLRTATFFPEPRAGAYVGAEIAAGARVFKAHFQVGAYDPRDPLLDPVWGQLADAGVPVVVHAGSSPVPGAYTGPAIFADVLARHPRLRPVIAHMGAAEYAEFLQLAERHEGVLLDTTMAFTDFLAGAGAAFPPALLPRVSALRDRVLFGSDFPNVPYAYAHQLEVLVRLGLGDDWLRAVCHDNAAELFGLPPRGSAHPGDGPTVPGDAAP